MADPRQFLEQYGHALLFGAIFVEQLGLPIPSAPLLVAAGALAEAGRLHPFGAVALPVAAALAANFIWYELGRRRGVGVLRLLCRISLEPDSCVRNTEEVFAKHGARSLLVAKFVPGLNTVAPPLAGVFRMRPERFALFNGLGTILWVSVYVALGYSFGDPLRSLVGESRRFGAGLVFLLVGAVALWLGVKYLQRRRFIRRLRIDRITPQELQRKLEAGENVVIVDLRGSLDFEAEPRTIPGALRVRADEIDSIRDELARAAEVVLYGT